MSVNEILKKASYFEKLAKSNFDKRAQFDDNSLLHGERLSIPDPDEIKDDHVADFVRRNPAKNYYSDSPKDLTNDYREGNRDNLQWRSPAWQSRTEQEKQPDVKVEPHNKYKSLLKRRGLELGLQLASAINTQGNTFDNSHQKLAEQIAAKVGFNLDPSNRESVTKFLSMLNSGQAFNEQYAYRS